MAVYSTHNKYVSIPDWFTSQKEDASEKTAVSTAKQTVVVGGSSSGASSGTGISEINLYNKFVLTEVSLNKDALVNENVAIIAVKSEINNVGDLLTANGWYTTEYISIAANSLMTITASVHDNYGLVFYDNTKTVISGTAFTQSPQDVQVPKNAVYYRISSNDVESFSILYFIENDYSSEQLEQSNSNIEDYLYLDASIPEGCNTVTFTNDSFNLLVQKPLSLTKDKNNIIKLSLPQSLDGVWELKIDEETEEPYIFTKYPVVTQYGVTMYADLSKLNLPDIYAGLPTDATIIRNENGVFGIPIDNTTIVLENGKLTVVGGTGSDVATEVAWTNVKGKPSWLEDDKVSYTEVEGLTNELKKYVTIEGDENVIGVHPFVNGLKIGSLLINQLQDKDVVYIDGHLAVKGGITMYVDNGTVDLPNLYDGFPTDGTIVKNENGSFGIPIDNSTIVLNNGKLTVVGGTNESGGLDEVKVSGTGNAITSASLSNNILTLTKETTFLDQASGDRRYLLTSEYNGDYTVWGQTYWNGGKPASVKGDLVNVGNIKFETTGKNIGEWGKGAELTFSNAVISKGSGQSLWLVGSSYLDTNGIVFGRNDEGSRSEEIARINSIGLYPYDSNSLTLGTSSKLWKHVYTSEVTVDDINIKKSASGILYIDANLVVKGGITMYATDATSGPSVIDSLPIANASGTKGIATFDATYFKVTDGKVTLVDDLALDEYVTSLGTEGNYLTYTKNEVVNKVTVPYATTANKLSAARTISLTGHATGSGSFDGSSDLGIEVVIPTRNVYINGTGYTVHSAITTDTTGIYAPISGGTSGYVLKANGATSVPTWIAQSSLSVGYAAKPFIKNSSYNHVFPIIFTNDSLCGAPGYDSLYVDTAAGSGYNPSTNTFYATTFSGALSGNATSASKLTTVSKTAWGQTYWTSGGVPTDISGDMTNVGSITMSGALSVGKLITGSNGATISGTVAATTLATNVFKFNDGYKGDLSSAGWYRFATSTTANNAGGTYIFHIRRSYYTTNNESYIISATVDFGGCTFTQLAGHYNTQHITQIRCTYDNEGAMYFDLYYSGTVLNTVYVNAIGDCTLQIPTKTTSTLSVTNAHAFTDGFKSGVKTDYALTLYRNATSGGCYIRYGAGGQLAKTWAAGSNASHQFAWFYKDTDAGTDLQKMYLDSSGNLFVTGNVYTDNSYFVKSKTGAGNGYSLYHESLPTQYGIFMGTTSNFNKHGGVTGGWATYFCMNSYNENRGWIFRNSYNDTNVASITTSGDLLVNGGITMYSDERKKTILNHVELSLKEIADAPLIEHYYNSDDKKTIHVGSIAQYWAGLNDWFCKKDDEGFYTMEIQNAALASAISVARELSRYESETDKRIRLLEEENQILKNEIENLRKNK